MASLTPPARHAPRVAAANAARADTPLPGVRWRMAARTVAHGLRQPYARLNGSKSLLAGVWSDYGITVQPAAVGDLAHSSVIFLLDRRGNERVEFADVPDPTWMENDIKLLASS